MLANDTDPDNDPLFVAQLPTLVRPADRTVDALDLSLTPDGELFFNPDAAGTYVFNYSATDGEETDVAQIRIEVGAPTENRPPIAVRDDVVIPAGGSRLVYVLENDGDPDGDVVGLVGHTEDDGLTREGGRGRRLPRHRRPRRAGPPDVPLPDLRRQVRPGVGASSSSPSPTRSTVDQPPVARADVVEVRAGGKVPCRCWRTTTTPRAASSRSSSVTPFDGADVAPGLNGQTVDVARRRRRDLQLHAQLHRRRRGREPVERLPRGAHRARRRGQPPADRPHRHRPHAQRRAGARSRSSPTTPTPTATSSPPRTSAPSRPAASPRVEDGAVVYTPSDTFTGTDRFTYALVDAGGEIAIGEVLVGVMPLAGANRAPEAFDDTVEAVAGSAPLVFDVLDNDSDPDGDRVHVTDGRHAVERRRPRSPTTAARVVFTPPADVARRAGDGDRLHVLDRRRPRRHRLGHRHRRGDRRHRGASRPIAVDDQVGPVTPGQTVELDLLANDLDPDGNPAELAVELRATRRSPIATAASSRSPPARRRAATSTRSPTPPGSPTRPRSPCSSCPTGRRSSRRSPAQTPANEPITIDLGGQAVDPDGDTLYFACCDNPQGGAATTVTNGAGAADACRSTPTTTSPGRRRSPTPSTTSRATPSPAR